jgi:hypothetical protein
VLVRRTIKRESWMPNVFVDDGERDYHVPCCADTSACVQTTGVVATYRQDTTDVCSMYICTSLCTYVHAVQMTRDKSCKSTNPRRTRWWFGRVGVARSAVETQLGVHESPWSLPPSGCAAVAVPVPHTSETHR